jgi:hypothetical protein
MELAMTDVTFDLSRISFGRHWIAALFGRPLAQAMMASNIRRTLDELPDAVLKDIGLVRSDIPFAVNALLSQQRVVVRNVIDRHDRMA